LFDSIRDGLSRAAAAAAAGGGLREQAEIDCGSTDDTLDDDDARLGEVGSGN